MENLDFNPIEHSICTKCKHYMVRIMVPLDIEEFEVMYSDEIGDDDEVEFEQHTCLILNMDLNHIVLKCNKFEPKESPFFRYDLN